MALVMLPVDDRLKDLIGPMQALCKAALDALERAQEHGDVGDYGAFEEVVADAACGVEGAVHATVLAKLDVDQPRIRVWGQVYSRVGRYEADYKTLAGAVRVRRSIYRKLGERNGPTVDPVSLRAGVVEDGWLPRTAQSMAYLMANGTSREAGGISQQLTRLPYSRSSFERIGHAVGRLYRSAAPRIEAALVEDYELPAGVESLSVSIDRVALPMEEDVPAAPALDPAKTRELEALRASGRCRFEVSARTLAAVQAQQEGPRRKVERNWRMAYCATVTLHDATGEALHTIRYGRMPKGDVEGLMRGLARDIQALLGKRPDLKLVYLADGAPELWNLYERCLPARVVGREATRLVDFWHVAEYLGAAAHLLEVHGGAWPGLFKRWRGRLLEEPEARHAILAELRASGLEHRRNSEGKRVVGDAIRYLQGRLDKLCFAEARRLGLPIGSGQVEATCKSLVALRMKRPGARWKRDSGEEVLQLRALILSDRWQPAMRRSLSRLRKPVKALPTHATMAA